MMKGWQVRLAIAAMLLVLGVCGRLVPHPPNFTPVAACALFAGFLLGPWLALPVILVTMLASDAVIGGYEPRVMAVVYSSLVVSAVIGRKLAAHPSAARVIVGTLASSVTFFAATNFAVWAFSGFYATDAAGLRDCFAAALPFFRYTLAGDLAWSSALFGTYALAMLMGRRYAFARQSQPSRRK